MITVTGISTNVDTNQTDVVAILHLYRDASNYLAFATETIWLNSEFYRGVIDYIGTWSEKWNLETNNTVTQSTPSITIKNEVYPDRSGSVISTLTGNTYIGNRAVIKLGYKGLAYASYITLYDGRVDDIEIEGEEVTINLQKAELPATHVGGRRINNQLLGDDSYSITVPEESHDRYLPVPFGNHWNAPLVLYRKTDTDSTYWCYADFDWYSGMNTNASTGVRVLAFQRDNLWQSGSYVNQAVVLTPNDGELVPLYSKSPYSSTAVNFSRSLDASTSNTTGAVVVTAPGSVSQTIHHGKQVTLNVPLRLYRLSGTGHAADWNNITPTPSDSDIDDMLSDDIDDILSVTSNVGGTVSEVIFNAILDIDKQLRTESRFCVNPHWRIHIPSPSDTSGGDQWTQLVMAVMHFDDGAGGDSAFESRNYMFAFRVGNNRLTYDLPDPTTSDATWLGDWNSGNDWENFIGCTFVGRGFGPYFSQPYYPPSSLGAENAGQDSGYNYYTHARANDGGVAITTENLFDISADAVRLNQTADAGNATTSTDQSQDHAYAFGSDQMMDFPFLRRNALDDGIGFRVVMRFNDAAGNTEDVTANYYLFYLEAIETVPFEWDEDKYSFVKGYQDTNYSGQLATFSAEFADETFQYVEAIIRRKLGVAASGLHSEWAGVQEVYDDFFASDRTGSGFVTPTDEELKFDEFIPQYCEHEPFTVYRDQLGLYRWLQFPIDLTSLNGRSYFTVKRDSIDYNDCDLGFGIKLSDKKYLCSEVKECLTDYIYHDGDYALKEHWKIADGGSYSYTHWDSDNSYADNKQFIERIEKKYTSFPEVSRVKDAADSTKGYNCLVTNEGTSIPLVRSAEGDVKYWTPLAGTSADWGTLTSYAASGQSGHWVGWDAENKSIAAYKINQWCNRHRVVTCASQKPKFLKYEIGDLIQFQNVPFSCIGLTINGFNGDVLTNTVTVNGQDVYSWFIVTRVTKSLGRVELECMQLHRLDQFIVERKSRIPSRRYRGGDRIPATSIGKISEKISKRRAFNRL